MDQDLRFGSSSMEAGSASEAATNAPAVAAPAVFGLFPTSQALVNAIKQLEAAGFDRADLSLPEMDPPPERATPELGAKPPDTDIDAQQSRSFHSGVGGSIGAMAAALVVAVTGGTLGAMIGAAIGGGLAVAAPAHLISRAASRREQGDRDRKVAKGRLVLSVRVPKAERAARATDILRQSGATRVW